MGYCIIAFLLIEVLLCIDRIIYILYPLAYGQKQQLILLAFALPCVLLTLVFWYWINSWIEIFPKFSATPCMYWGCLTRRFVLNRFLYTRLIFYLFNMASCLAMFLLLKYYRKTNINATNKHIIKNLIIINVISVLCDFFPSVISLIISAVSKKLEIQN